MDDYLFLRIDDILDWRRSRLVGTSIGELTFHRMLVSVRDKSSEEDIMNG
jgi:hypothetical protein